MKAKLRCRRQNPYTLSLLLSHHILAFDLVTPSDPVPWSTVFWEIQCHSVGVGIRFVMVEQETRQPTNQQTNKSNLTLLSSL